MKNILFATTALVATAGIASADVSISGFAEMGIFDNGSGDMQFFNDIDVTFSMSGETDGGLSFGASVDLDEVSDTVVNKATDNNSEGGIAANISGGFGTITLGDTDGASDWAMTETAIGGAMADDHTVHAGYSGNSGYDGLGGGQILRWNHTIGTMGVAVSMQQANNGAASANDDTMQAGLKYSMDAGDATVALGLGFVDAGTQGAGDSNSVGISVKVASGNLTGILNYTDGETEGVSNSHTGFGIGYSMDALTVGVNYGEKDHDTNGKTDGFGLAVNYSMGGGAVFQLGYGDGEGTDTMSMGLALSF